MKTSQIVAKAVTRLFILLLLLASIPLFQADSAKLHHIYFVGNNKWTLVFPGLLLAGFIGLFIYCSIKKFSIPDLNWVLVINTLVLMAYCATLYMRIYEIIK
ncbi:MAG TPA: hypothetical protein VK668_23625 [Mucilaginibacter sp.]|nr:hypothetical protein [Mucilaginibacter sp.]